jgi:putative acetyltransferase
MTITIRQATSNDLGEVVQLFRETIEVINAKDYSPEQINVWKNGSSKKERWLNKFAQHYFLLAEINNKIVGFGSMTAEGYLDFMYVNKDHQSIGVATEIYNKLEKFALANQLDKITSDVSITAKPFFERKGFEVIREQQVDINGIKLANYKMQKQLTLH